MSIWNWRSAATIWIFCALWVHSFNACAPARESMSRSQVQADIEGAAAAKQSQLDADAQTEYYRQLDRVLALGMPAADDREPEEPWFFEVWLDEGEASSP